MIDLRKYDFIDVGSSSGGAIDFAKSKFGWGSAIGIDLDEKKVNLANKSGREVVLGDATQLSLTFQGRTRCAILSHFLEHLPNLTAAKSSLTSLGNHVLEDVFIQQPFFDFKNELATFGLKFFWSDWSGHKNMMTLKDWRDILEELVNRTGIYEVAVLGMTSRVYSSLDESLIPLNSEKNSSSYNPDVHPPKVNVEFEIPLYKEVKVILQKRKNEKSLREYVAKLNLDVDSVFGASKEIFFCKEEITEADKERVFQPICGKDYFLTLSQLHKTLLPKIYFEIGTATGLSLNIAACESVAVDPFFQLKQDVLGMKPRLLLIQKTSDDFFNNDAMFVFRNSKIDMAFLDGMHLFEYALRDFINTEKHMASNGIIVLHDCLPPDIYIACRNRGSEFHKLSKKPAWWTGDVWKIVVILKRYRPDLIIEVYDSAPTGLVIVRKPDPKSMILQYKYNDLVSEFMPITLEEYGLKKFRLECEIRSSNDLFG